MSVGMAGKRGRLFKEKRRVSQCWARLKPGTTPGSHARAAEAHQASCATFSTSPRPLGRAGRWIRSAASGTGASAHSGFLHLRLWLYPLCHNASTDILLLNLSSGCINIYLLILQFLVFVTKFHTSMSLYLNFTNVKQKCSQLILHLM